MNRSATRLLRVLALASVSLQAVSTVSGWASAEEARPAAAAPSDEEATSTRADDEGSASSEPRARSGESESRVKPELPPGNNQPALPVISGGALQTMQLPTGGSKSGVSSQSISVPQGAGKIEGMGESFSAQLSTGIGTFGVPFVLPSARGFAQPSLGLSYSSSGGHGLAGAGWDLSVPFISRQTDRGVPGYADPSPGGPWGPTQDRFVFNGGQELVPICLVASNGSCIGARAGEVIPAKLASWQYFRPRVEGLFMRFFWSPDHRTWLIQSKSGVTMELGVPLDSTNYIGALETAPSDPTRIFRWNIAREYDAQVEVPAPTGLAARPVNLIVFRYMTLAGGPSYLTDVYDTPPRTAAATAPLAMYAHHTRIGYEARTDPTQSFRRGWQVTQALRIRSVDVTSKSFTGTTRSGRQMVRRYHIAYEPGSHVSLLASVTLEGRCASSVAENVAGDLPVVTACTALPPVQFGYQHVTPFTNDGQPGLADLPGYEGFDERVQHFAASPAYSIDGVTSDLFDVNADSLPDVLVTQPALFQGKHGLFLNGIQGNANTFGASSIGVTGVLGANAGTIVLSNTNIVPADLDGDGVVDLLHMPQVKTYSVYTPVHNASGWTWLGRAITTAAAQNPKIDFVNHEADTKVMDVDGDGLVDVVFSAGTQMQTFFALGRYPGGDGQFGHASWAGPDAATLFNEPVTSCVPWSATPIKLSDPDVRIADMNGDGLPDIVRVRDGQIQYWPGRGTGFWGTGLLDDCPAGGFGQDRHIAMASSPQFFAPNGPPRLEDVNGDGLADLVQVRFNAVDIWLNVDGVGWTSDRHIIQDTPPAAPINSHLRITDANGSGTRDILWGDANDYKYIDLLGGKQPWVLTHIANGLGKTTDLQYRTSTELMLADELAGDPWQSKAPSPLQVVTQVTVRDNLETVGAVGGAYVIQYSYRDPVYDGRQREFRGFRSAITRHVGDPVGPTASSPTSLERSTFLLGGCVDENTADAVDSCSVAQRWRDNPREALKGLPSLSEVFDTTGVYLSTSHTTYRLRTLYAGLDGRVVRHAFASTVDTFLYDVEAGPGAPSSYAVRDIEVEDSPGVIAPENPLAAALVVRVSAGTAQLRSRSVVDYWGNATDAVAYGCIAGCPAIDETITSHTEPGRPVGDPSGWLWRSIETFVVGSNSPAVKRHRSFIGYEAAGNVVQTSAELTGTLPLARAHEDPAKAVAPAPPGASADGNLQLEARTVDMFGNVTARSGAGARCSSVNYDTNYAQLPVSETVLAGALSGACGSVALTTSADYDRGLAQPTKIFDLHGEVTLATYDGFGRITALQKPDPAVIGVASVLPSIQIEYYPSQPYSTVHTMTLDGVDASDPSYRNSWAYVDGLGRIVVTFEQADPSAHDGGDWIVSGRVEYDQKGGIAKAYLPWFTGLTPPGIPVSTPTAYKRMTYDAFGRVKKTFNLDGSNALQNAYHALSVDASDAEDLGTGLHSATPVSERKDGHGRKVSTIARTHVSGSIEQHETRTSYLPTGEIETIARERLGFANPPVIRWIRYDSLGRMVLNVDPNTTVGFNPSPATDASTLKAWRYAYNDAGDLVGTSDGRGCGSNFHYDTAGRILAEDYSPCLNTHAAYSAPDLATGIGTEVTYRYDILDPDSATVPSFAIEPQLLSGRLVSVTDRAQKTLTRYDGRGRSTGIAKRIAKPGVPSDDPSLRYAPRWYTSMATFDGADRPSTMSTGASAPSLMGAGNASVVATTYSKRGTVKQVAGSYGVLVAGVTRDADGLVKQIDYGDLAQTTTASLFDARRRLSTVQTYRAAPPAWTVPPANYLPAPPSGAAPSTLQLLLEDTDFTYDDVDNPIAIHDWRNESEWPAGAKPVHRVMQYDDLYRLSRIDATYVGGSTWVSPFDAENSAGTGSMQVLPSPHVSFPQRILYQSFNYDWLGNSTGTDDDAKGFYDRSLGTIAQGNTTRGPYQLYAAGNSAASVRSGTLDTSYDISGNLTGLWLQRNGPCLPAGAKCSQRLVYEWDEVGRLARARRWDITSVGTRTPTIPVATPDADLRYTYDSDDQRVLKTAQDALGAQRHTVYVFGSLELRGADWLVNSGNPALSDYEDSVDTEVPYLAAHGVSLGRVAYDANAPSIAGGKMHVLLELTDHLGSTGIVIDKSTGELVERTTYQVYGSTESDYRPARWGSFREDHRFTGKEEDVEVGLMYFGARYYAPGLGRWISPDPLAVHGLGADLNLYAYVHGAVLRATDPSGLSESDTAQMSSAEGLVSEPGPRIDEAGPGSETSAGPPSRALPAPAPLTISLRIDVPGEPQLSWSPLASNAYGHADDFIITTPWYDNVKGNAKTDPGHAFVEFSDPNKGSLTLGWYPLVEPGDIGSVQVGVVGSLHDDSAHVYDYSASFEVNRTKFDAGLARALSYAPMAQEFYPGMFQMPKWGEGKTCIDFSNNVLSAAGIKLPPSEVQSHTDNSITISGIAPGAVAHALSSAKIGDYVLPPAGTMPSGLNGPRITLETFTSWGGKPWGSQPAP
jgi:RHS repeat-associated protein